MSYLLGHVFQFEVDTEWWSVNKLCSRNNDFMTSHVVTTQEIFPL